MIGHFNFISEAVRRNAANEATAVVDKTVVVADDTKETSGRSIVLDQFLKKAVADTITLEVTIRYCHRNYFDFGTENYFRESSLVHTIVI